MPSALEGDKKTCEVCNGTGKVASVENPAPATPEALAEQEANTPLVDGEEKKDEPVGEVPAVADEASGTVSDESAVSSENVGESTSTE